MVMGLGVAPAPFATLETREVEEEVLVDCLEKGPLTGAVPLRVGAAELLWIVFCGAFGVVDAFEVGAEGAGDEKEEGRLAKVLALVVVAEILFFGG